MRANITIFLLFLSLTLPSFAQDFLQDSVASEEPIPAMGIPIDSLDMVDAGFENDTLAKKQKREKKSKPPKIKLPPDSLPRPTLFAGVGVLNFYGDVKGNENANTSPVLGNMAYTIGLSQELSSATSLNLYFRYGKLSANERSLQRNLNFESQITALGANVTYNFNHFLNPGRKVTPFISLGIESFEFHSKADLKDKYGNTYHYWSDGSIRNVSETGPDAEQSQIILRDYSYETDLRTQNYDGEGNYPERSIAIPIGVGAQFDISSKVKFNLGTSYHLTFTDLIDNVNSESSGERIGSRNGNSRNDRFLYTHLSLSFNFTRSTTGKREIKDAWEPAELLAFGDDDYDGDGIKDFIDDCPDSPPGNEVDERGCPLNPPSFVPMTDEEIYENYLAYMDSTGLYAKIQRNFSSENQKVFGPFRRPAPKKFKKSFKVKLGEFEGGVPAEVSNQMLSVPDVETHVQGNKTIFTVGSYDQLPDAIKRKIEAAKEGFEDAEIVLQNSNGEIISLGDEGGNLDLDASSFEPDLSTPYIFRVQLGAFKKKKPDDAFRNVQNLVVVENEQGFTKYMSGAFDEYALAAQHKIDMIAEGWKGAFVVAYRRGQGKRVTMQTAGVTAEKAAEAQRLIKGGKVSAAINEVPEPEPAATFDKSRVKFKIQIGIYKNDVPGDVLNDYMRLNNLEQLAVDTSDFATRYTSGEFSDYASAVDYRNKLIQKGFKTAFIIALKDDQLISIDAARKLLGEDL
jgi:hypothetical protein